MTVNAPKGKFLVIAQLTENSPGGRDKGYRYIVREPIMNAEQFPGVDAGRGDYAETLDQAKARIECEKKTLANRYDASGLIDWGKAAAREYAIFEVSFTPVE